MRILNQEKEHDMDQDNVEAGLGNSGCAQFDGAQSDGAQSQETRYDVFLSYSHKDAELYGKERILSIKKEIEAELFDITCRPLVFLDSEALNYGDNWHAKILEQLNKCRVFICLLSDNYLDSSYCTRERLWWERKEIQEGRLRKDTQPVYYISLKNDSFKSSESSKVRDLAGFEMDRKPWFDGGVEEVKDAYLKERVENLKKAVKEKFEKKTIAISSFNTVFPEPTRYFTGRILELKELREICAGGRYPVIEGNGGVGKTELAAVYAYGYAEDYPQGRFLIHMEGKRSWEDAVLSLINDPETGRDVRRELGISDEEMQKGKDDLPPEKRRNLHRLIVEKLFVRAKKDRLLLLLDNVVDASLFRERELQDFSLKRPIPDNIHMIATTRHKLAFPNERHRAKAFPIGNLDDDASFELFCEIGRNMFPFCRNMKAEAPEKIVDLYSDPEYKAAMEIIHLLNGHVWSLEIIAGQVANGYDDGVTLRNKLDSLRECFSIEGEGESWRNPADNPGALIRGTLNILKERENGDVIILLAYFAALLHPDGKKKDILQACWEKLFADVTFKNKGVDSFLCAYNHLWRYNLLHNKDDDKMHRLTQAGLKQIVRECGTFEECVKALTEAMVGITSISHMIWIETISATPEIVVFLKQKYPRFFSDLLPPWVWVKLLFANPTSPILIEMCPWNKLTGEYWAELLSEQPRFADKCVWAKLDGYNWAVLLADQPQLEDRCNKWGDMDGDDWAVLLADQPRFLDKCEWEKLEGKNWAWLLGKHPQFANKCDKWNDMDGYDWACLLLVHQPQFANKCDKWDDMGGYDWADLLSRQPQFSGRCPWDKLNGWAWARLVESQPQFIDKIPWDKLDGWDWACLLEKQPQFIDRIPWDKLDGWDWSSLLAKQPQYANRCPWDKLSREDWGRLLEEQPQFADKCSFDELKN